MVTIELRQLKIEPGEKLLLHDVSWEKFESILKELGEHRNSRIAYYKGTLEIMAPLPEHEKANEFVSDFAKILLEELDLDAECFGSTTFNRQDLNLGLEPDQCFYIKHHALMRGLRKLDLTIDPPPDLAIEIDVTSKTKLDIYRELGVPEVWLYGKVKHNMSLRIFLLQNGEYLESTSSPNFPNIPLLTAIPRFIDRSTTMGRRETIKAFRAWVRSQI